MHIEEKEDMSFRGRGGNNRGGFSRGGFSRGGGGGFNRGGRGGGRGGFGRGGGRGGFNRGGYDQGPPESVVSKYIEYQRKWKKQEKEANLISQFFFFAVLGQFMHPCEDDIVCKCVTEENRVPYFNAPVYLENKEQIGKVDEIFGQLRDFVSFDCVLLNASISK